MSDPVTGSIGGTIIKASVGVVVKNTPLGLQKIGAWAKAKKILIIGQERAGKSTLFLTLQTGELFPEMETKETRAARQSGLISLGIENTTKVISFKQVKDIPGHFSFFAQADLFRKTKASIVVVMLDATRDDNVEWIRSFSDEIEKQWNTDNRKQRYKNGNLIILLNKIDKIHSQDFEAIIEEVKSIITTSDFVRINNFTVNALPSSLVTNGFNDLAKTVIQTLMRISME
jgi:GTPase SAR1 family protein